MSTGRSPYIRKPSVSPPLRYKGDGRLLGEYEIYFRRYAEYEGQMGEDAIKLLPFSLGGEALECYNTMTNIEKTSIDTIFKKLRDRFCPPSFKLLVHEELCSEKQKEGESVNDYIVRFNKMSQILDLPQEQQKAQFISNLKGDL